MKWKLKETTVSSCDELLAIFTNTAGRNLVIPARNASALIGVANPQDLKSLSDYRKNRLLKKAAG